jgi:hypothetical protein
VGSTFDRAAAKAFSGREGTMHVFIGGVMQGSNRGQEINDQGYRQIIAGMIKARHPDAEITDPYALFPDGVEFDDDRARQVFFDLVEVAASADVVVAYLPEASMGTALEMVRAHDAGVPVISISPLAKNWFVRFLSRRVFPTLEAFGDWVAGGGLEAMRDFS